MKLLLLCAGGASTSILMKKMEKYAEANGIDFTVEAHGVSAYEDYVQNFDVIMLGPQISYKRDTLAQETGKPVGVVASLDYALGNAENIFNQIKTIYPEE